MHIISKFTVVTKNPQNILFTNDRAICAKACPRASSVSPAISSYNMVVIEIAGFGLFMYSVSSNVGLPKSTEGKFKPSNDLWFRMHRMTGTLRWRALSFQSCKRWPSDSHELSNLDSVIRICAFRSNTFNPQCCLAHTGFPTMMMAIYKSEYEFLPNISRRLNDTIGQC